MIRIFLAYASEDKEAVTHLYQRLKERGFHPWLDKVDLLPGQNWRAEIPKAIRESGVFIACLSKKSVAKQGYIQREFRMALQKMGDMPTGKIYLIPVRLNDCQVPELRQEEYGINLADYQWVDLFQDGEFERLVKSIELHFPNAIATSNPKLQTFTFETVKVNNEGSITSRKQRSAQYFRQELGSGAYLDMVQIPGGIFWMGSPKDEADRKENEGPQHKVAVPTFYMSKYPITQRQWYAVSLLPDVDRSIKPHPSRFKGDDLPVERVSWFSTVEFCKRLSRHTEKTYRLPSEAEWEYACRAGTLTQYYFGDNLTKEHAHCGENLLSQTTLVGMYPPNAFGLYDTHGNVWEWCLDNWHNNYDGAPYDGSAWVEGGYLSYRVLRGGSWADTPVSCRSARRNSNKLVDRNINIGFRVVCSAPGLLL
ncbi:SUMF1/EgtB/PvdO family nonheme iron enzyme [Leptothoe sp. EHU-05/26/07-4]